LLGVRYLGAVKLGSGTMKDHSPCCSERSVEGAVVHSAYRRSVGDLYTEVEVTPVALVSCDVQ